MHEMGIVMQVIEIVTERAHRERRDHVSRVVLVVGKLSAVLPDALRFAWDVATEGSIMHGAHLEIVEKNGLARCRACNANVIMERPIGLCECGSTDLEWLEGDELHVREIECSISEGERA